MVERGMEFLANKTGFVALFDRWTAEMKYLSTNAVFGEFSHAMRILTTDTGASQKEITKATEMLRSSGISQEMQDRIWAQYALPGGSTEFKDGFRLPNTEAWTDFDAMMTMKSSVLKVVNDLIVTPGLDKPSWTDQNLAFKMVAQFRSFTFASTNRVLISGLQEADMALVQGMSFSLALGALSYYTWAVASGGDAYEEAMQLDTDKWIFEAGARSGLYGVLAEGQKLGEQIPGINDWALFGANESRSQRAGSLLGAVFGPSYSLAEKLATVVQGMDDPTQATYKAARTSMVAYQNVFYFRRLLDLMMEGMFDVLDVPEKRVN